MAPNGAGTSWLGTVRGSMRVGYFPPLQREREVLALVVTGLLNKQIAAKPGTTEFTVKFQRRRVMQKMRVESVAEPVRMAKRLSIPSPKEKSIYTNV
jgi:DNA-binding CsgD family transcriptional regulator